MKKYPTVLLFLFASLDYVFAQQINPTIVSNDNKKVFILGSGTADAVDFASINASGGMSLCIKPIKKTTAYLSFNFGGNVSDNEKSDSAKFSSLYFPDNGRSAFTGCVEYSILPLKETTGNNNERHNLILDSEGSVQQRNIESDSLIYKLNIANIALGFKYKWSYFSPSSDNRAIFSLGIFYNGIFINRNSEKSFNELFNGPLSQTGATLPRNFGGISCLLSLQFNNAILYFRTYQLNTMAADLAFTVGIKANGSFFSF